MEVSGNEQKFRVKLLKRKDIICAERFGTGKRNNRQKELGIEENAEAKTYRKSLAITQKDNLLTDFCSKARIKSKLG